MGVFVDDNVMIIGFIILEKLIGSSVNFLCYFGGYWVLVCVFMYFIGIKEFMVYFIFC